MTGGTKVQWPANLKRTATRQRWYDRFEKLKPGLSLRQVAKQLRESYASVYRWAEMFGYKFPDMRRRGRVTAAQWDKVDWELRDADIARDLNVSRERVRQVRALRNAGPSAHRAQVDELLRWARQRRTKLHGLPIAQTLSEFGGELSQQVARRVLRSAGVKPHHPGSRWRQVDWRLPNRDLADLWETSPKYVANIRARLQAGAARWEAKGGKLNGDARYFQAFNDEKKRARNGAPRKGELVEAR
ncbi:MAG TPA: hypothetical protein VH370_06495 [Humisphaera sp.]|jgi:transposase|nr:hypothetical protein [Humisphaera sp.]